MVVQGYYAGWEAEKIREDLVHWSAKVATAPNDELRTQAVVRVEEAKRELLKRGLPLL